MLAQNFKSAEDLLLTDKQRAALITVLGMLERDEIPHFDTNVVFKVPEGDWFGMSHWRLHREGQDCGTVMCIGGWADAVGGFLVEAGTSLSRVAEMHARLFGGGHLDQLFYPSEKPWS